MITWHPSSTPLASDLGIRHAALPRGGKTKASWWRVLAFWIERSRQRRALSEIAKLSPDRLDDIGVTRPQAIEEAGKPFWR